VKIQPDGESLTAERKGDHQLHVEGKNQDKSRKSRKFRKIKK